MIKLIASGILPWLVKTGMKVVMRLAQAFIEVIRDVLSFLPKKVQKFLGLDLNAKNPFEELANNMDSGIGDFGSALGEFGESYVESNKQMTQQLKEANASHEEVVAATNQQSTQMQEATSLYQQSSLQGMATQTAIARAQAKQNASAQKHSGGARGSSGGARVSNRRGSPGVLANSIHSPLGMSPLAIPPPPELNIKKSLGDLSGFSPDEIIAGKATAEAYNQQHMQDLANWARNASKIQIRLSAPSGLHPSSVR